MPPVGWWRRWGEGNALKSGVGRRSAASRQHSPRPGASSVAAGAAVRCAGGDPRSQRSSVSHR